MDKACKCEHYSGGPLSFEVASYPNNQKDPSHFILLTPIEYGRTERRTNFHRIPLLKAFIREDISCVDGGYLSMAFPLFRTKASVFVSLIFLLMLGLAACGSDSVTGTTPTPTTNPPGGATATAAVAALIKQMTLVGTPTASIVSGTTFEVDWKIKNVDDKQHDIFLKAVLLDASGKTIATSAAVNVDNVAGGATVAFSIQGTTPQATWARVQVTVVNVAENVNGAGPDLHP